MAGMLTEADVQRLMASPSSDVRAETAEKLAVAFDVGKLSAKERELTEAIFRVMMKDVEVMVSECASRADRVPVHMNLVDDIPEVRAAMEKSAQLILTHINPDVTPNGLSNTRVAEDFKTYKF